MYVDNSPCSSCLMQEQYYRVEGEKARAFLQGQLTNDLLQVSPSHWLSAAHCDIKGRIVALYHIWQKQDTLFLGIPADIAKTAIPTLEKYAKFSKVQLQPLEGLGTLAIWGTHSHQFLKDSLGIELNATKNCWQSEDVTVLFTENLIPCYHIIASLEICKSLQTSCGKISNIDTLKIDQGIARLYPDTQGLFTPHELNLPLLNAVSFQKGCYTGQEIIARMQYRGKIKSHLYKATTHTKKELRPGQELKQDDRTCGRLVMFSQLDKEEYALLVLLQDDAIKNPILLEETALQNITLATP